MSLVYLAVPYTHADRAGAVPDFMREFFGGFSTK